MTSEPNFPVVSGEYQMTKDWSITLPGKFKRRFEDGALVLWQPGLTAWVIVWGNNHAETVATRLAQIRADVSNHAYEIVQDEGSETITYSYRLNEQSLDCRVAAFYGFAIGKDGHVQIAVYFDKESTLPIAQSLLRSLRQTA